MALDHGRLAQIDRKVFAELDRGDGVQAVKVPVSDAVWSTWRRYCEAMGLSMGDGVAALILDELETVVGGTGPGRRVFNDLVASHAGERDLELDARQRELDAQAEQFRTREEYLRGWEQRLRTQRPPGVQAREGAKVGRNDRCPCGSGFKYKQCHGRDHLASPSRIEDSE